MSVVELDVRYWTEGYYIWRWLPSYWKEQRARAAALQYRTENRYSGHD